VLLSCLTVHPGLTLQQAQASRLAVTNSQGHRDDRDRTGQVSIDAHDRLTDPSCTVTEVLYSAQRKFAEVRSG
jgi:hypothetical protein